MTAEHKLVIVVQFPNMCQGKAHKLGVDSEAVLSNCTQTVFAQDGQCELLTL